MNYKLVKLTFINLFVLAALGGTAFAQSEISNFRFQISDLKFNSPKSDERVIAVDAKVSISFCVTGDGEVRVRGADRNEVRVFTDERTEGNAIGFKVLQRTIKNQPSWVMIVGYDLQNGKNNPEESECLSGENIELDVPRAAKVDVKSAENSRNITIESVARANVENINGDVLLRDISAAAEASSLSGNITAEDSTGRIALKSLSGDVAARRVRPVEPLDSCVLKSTSGTVLLQDAAHRAVQASSTSGAVAVSGQIIANADYTLNSNTGSITLLLPLESSFAFKAVAAATGRILTSFPFKILDQSAPNSGGSQSLRAVHHTGAANISVTTFSGTIRLRKQQ